MAKTILKKTNRKVAVKIAGAGADEDIVLATDCKLTDETVASPTVSILSMTWTGDTDATATITRGTTIIAVLQGNAASTINFADAEYTDTVASAEDINVVTAGEMSVYLLLRKESGYTVADPQQYTELPY